MSRELAASGKKVILCEKNPELLGEASSGNTGHLATNFYYRRDRAVLEAEMIGRARLINPDWVGQQPAVPCRQTGLTYLARGSQEEEELERILELGTLNGVPGLRRLSVEELAEMEPALNTEGITAGLYSEQEYIVDSWLLSMTHVYGMEVAGVSVLTDCEVVGLEETGGAWKVRTTRGLYFAEIVVNCAGNFGDQVELMANKVTFSSTGTFHTDWRFPIFRGRTSLLSVYIFQSVYGHTVVGPTNVRQISKTDRRDGRYSHAICSLSD